MTKNSDSSEQQHYPVTIHHHERGELGDGTLSFGGNHLARVKIKNGPIALREGDRFDVIKATADSGRIYTLCACKLLGFRLYADYVIEADITAAEFDQIVVRYYEASKWFLHWQNVNGQIGDQLTWGQKSKPLSVTVSTAEEEFSLTSEYVGSSEFIGEDIVIHEHVEFTFSPAKRKFDLSDLRKKTHELSCLLSILIAYPATTMNVEVGLNNGRLARVHFPGFKHPEREATDSTSNGKWFIQKPLIEDKWQTIFDRYYNSAYRKVCWIRLAGMQRYEGFWEYKALGYVSLLDRYVTIRCKNLRTSSAPSIPKSKITKFRQKIVATMPSLGASEIDGLAEIVENIFSSVPKVTFSEKYQGAISGTDPDIVKVISLSNSDFQFIKKIRDKIAHGDDPGLQEDDYPKVSDMVGKIALLLTYWAFLDFGLTRDDFVACLKTTHSTLRLSCSLNQVQLDRMTGSAEFFLTTTEKIDELAKIGSRTFLCFLLDSGGELSFSEKYTKMYKDWRDNPPRGSCQQQPEEIFGVDNDAARCIGHGYFECGEKRLEVFHMWIIEHAHDVH